MVRSIFLIGILACALEAQAGMSVVELVSWDTARGGETPLRLYSHVISGETAYINMTGSGITPLVRVDGLNGTQARTTIVSGIEWFLVAGDTRLTATKGMGLSHGYLQFGDVRSDAIWRVNPDTGGVIAYVDQASISNFTGRSKVYILDFQAVNPASGEHVFYEGESDGIYITTGSNAVALVADSTALSNAFGSTEVSGGMTYDAAGNLYWGNAEVDLVGMRTTGGVLQTALSQAQIEGVLGLGPTNLSFGAVFYAPDGWVYFFERGTRNIMRFDPSDPPGTLAIHVTTAELLAGPAAEDDAAGSFGWYHGFLTFNYVNKPAGIYMAVPEPGVWGLLGVGCAAVSRRERS